MSSNKSQLFAILGVAIVIIIAAVSFMGGYYYRGKVQDNTSYVQSSSTSSKTEVKARQIESTITAQGKATINFATPTNYRLGDYRARLDMTFPAGSKLETVDANNVKVSNSDFELTAVMVDDTNEKAVGKVDALTGDISSLPKNSPTGFTSPVAKVKTSDKILYVAEDSSTLSYLADDTFVFYFECKVLSTKSESICDSALGSVTYRKQ